jgi:hypothetical protein
MKCYLLGAGVSRSVGYPPGSQLFDEIAASSAKAEPVSTALTTKTIGIVCIDGLRTTPTLRFLKRTAQRTLSTFSPLWILLTSCGMTHY